MKIVEQLRIKRKKLGITQKELAKKLHTSQPQISFVESGKQMPTLQTVERICDALGVKIVLK